MPIVSNTSPILNLAIINYLDLLQRQFVQVLIPAKVLDEVRSEQEAPGKLSIRQALQDEWIRVGELQSPHLAHALALELEE